MNEPQWYKDAVIYQLHVKAFFDADGDGSGDFRGLIEKLDYLQQLGVSALWLLPFYPSPQRDDGYDVADYRGVHERYGTLRDFRTFVRAAHDRGMRVITECVINHTSDQHPWFQRARRAKPGSNARNFYVWSDSDDKYAGTRIIFTDTEKSNWAWDPVANAYYWHRFFSHQPDLNFDNPRVVEALANVMRFWFNAGVDGLRLDAVPYLCEREGTSNENLAETHDVIKQLRAILDAEYPDRFLLAEANQWPEDVRAYFGDGDECHMAFHFPLMPRLFLAVAAEDRYPIYDIMQQTPAIPDNCQWAIFLRNHDEMTLEMVTDRERAYMYGVYAPETRARINVGIRRRLAPLMENYRRKIELMLTLLFSMPGTPIIYYGDEIGMGDNIFLGDRDGVRTPMQWTSDRNGGFSRADTQRLYLPAIQDTVYGFEAINVEAQTRTPSSLLNWLKRMISVRQAHRVFGRGRIVFLYPENRHVIAFLREYEDEVVLCIMNLAQAAQAVYLDLSRFAGRTPIEMIGWSGFPPIVDDRYVFTLPGHAFFWFLLRADEAPALAASSAPEPEYVTLVLPRGWRSLAREPARTTFEIDLMPAYLAGRSWTQSADHGFESTRLVDVVPLEGVDDEAAIAIVDATSRDGRTTPYLVALDRVDENAELPPAVLRTVFARSRTAARESFVFDPTAGDRFWIRVLEFIRSGQRIEEQTGAFSFVPTWALETIAVGEPPLVRGMPAERVTGAVIDNAIFIKLYRRLEAGLHPEIELAKHLQEVGFAHVPPLLGSITYEPAHG
ncbi:MAG: maltose alpha-D-glucosyltransferase, partial [Vulcanimicrobiaceae bacterium]